MTRSTPALGPDAFTTCGELLRYLRRRQRLTQSELAIAVGYSTAQISRLEQNQRLPNPSTLQALFVPALGLQNEPDLVARLLELAHAAHGALDAEFPPLRARAALSRSPPAPAIPLLTTKLYVPPPRLNRVRRPFLIERLQAGITGKLTLITAPAGFGKTTLLSEWLAKLRIENEELRKLDSNGDSQFSTLNSQFKVAWVSLDAGDNDPTRFWSYVCAALDTLMPGVAAPILAVLQLSQPPPAETLLPSLLNAVSAWATDCVLVLDDYHVIDAPAIHAALAFLLEHVPPRLHVVIASRADPPLPLARLRARGELNELRVADLRFTYAEAASFLTELMGLPLSSEEVAALETRTEGWIAGLQLAALSMRGRHDLVGFISAFTGSNRFVGEYLAEEVFARQPPHIQNFLLQTSILSRMCGPLCDTVMLGGVDGAAAHAPQQAAPDDSFSQVLLEELERGNVFVVPLDDAQRWYRYHHLFGEMLREQLVHGTTREAVATLQQRASAWYERHGLIAEAVQHALAAEDWERAARMIEEHGLRLMLAGQIHTGLGWLNALPEAFILVRPLVCIVHAIGLMLSNQAAAAEARLRDAEHGLSPDTSDELVRLVRGSVAGVRGRILYLAGDLARAIGSLQQALAVLPETTTSAAAGITSAMARGGWGVYIGMAYKVTGDVTAASERRATDAIAPVRALGHMMATLNGYTSLAYLQMLQGRLHAAAATYAEVERLVPGQDALQALSGSPSYYVGMGDLWREWNDLDAAETYLARGIELIRGTLATEGDVILLGYLTLARVQQARGNGAAALATLDAFVELARERQLFDLLIEQAAAMRARLQLLQGDLDSAIRWAEERGISPDGHLGFPHEAAYLTLARIRIALGQAAKVMPLLGRLLADAETKARIHSAIEILVLQALAYDTLHDRQCALVALERALALAAPEGYIRVFVDEGAPMSVLLVACRAQLQGRGRTVGGADAARLVGYVETLAAALPKTEDRGSSSESASTHSVLGPQSSILIERLTERELELLRLTAAGHSNQQIADALIVSVGTVKKHLNNIFGKLGVQSRTQAVERAHALRLL